MVKKKKKRTEVSLKKDLPVSKDIKKTNVKNWSVNKTSRVGKRT